MFANLLQAQLFFYFMLLFVCCTLCNCQKLANRKATTAVNNVPLFKEGSVSPLKPNPTSTEEKEITFENINSFFLLAVDKLMVTLASVRKDKNADENNLQTHLLAKYIEINEENLKEGVLKTDKNNNKWKTQLVTKNTPSSEKYFERITSAVDVKTNKTYVFVVNGTESESNPQSISSENVEITLVVGTISTEEKQPTTGKTIKWVENKLSKLSDIKLVKDTFKDNLSNLLISDVISLVTENGNIVLLFSAHDKTNRNKNIIALVNGKESENNLVFLQVDNIEGCNPHIFPWGSEVVMITDDCKNKSNVKVIESTDITKLVGTNGPFLCLFKLLQNKKDFTPVTFSGTKLLLFTQLKEKQGAPDNGNQPGSYLFISDGTRVKEVGLIAADIEKDKPIRLLITDKELFTLHKKSNSDDHTSIILTRHEELLTKMQSVVDAWSKTDKIIKEMCTSSSEKQTLCIKELPTDSLVGFLSKSEIKSDGTILWQDEYQYVDATVTNGVHVNDGFQFNTPGAGAVWPVGTPIDGTPYNFVDFGFTLVATVNINKPIESEERRPLLGVALDENTKKITVYCSKNGVLAVSGSEENSEKETANKKCVDGVQYHAALVYNKTNKKVSVYVDWEPLDDGHNFEINEDSEKNLQFYFGAYSKEKTIVSHVTVTNVLLYNRPFTDDEIDKLKENNKKNAPPISQTVGSDIINDINSDSNNLDDNKETVEETINAKDTLITQINNDRNDVTISVRQEKSALPVGDGVGVLLFSFLSVWAFVFC